MGPDDAAVVIPSEVLEAGFLQADLLRHGGTCDLEAPNSRNGGVCSRSETYAQSRYSYLCGAPACFAPTG
jgi:hypothetical protein